MIISISGASGTGKSTLQTALVDKLGAVCAISNTTRQRRSTDKDSEYRFFTRVELLQLPGLLWVEEIHGNLYGTRRCDIEDQLYQHKYVVLVVNISGQIMLHQHYSIGSQILHVHLLSPGIEELRRRLTQRGESSRDVEQRVLDCLHWDNKAKSLPFLESIPVGSKQEAVQFVIDKIGS